MTEHISYIHIRIWFMDGEYYEKSYSSDFDIQWSLSAVDRLVIAHGPIETIIIDTEW